MDPYKKILFSLLALALIVWPWQLIHSHDIWWHLATGRYIIENHALPRVDVFSSTVTGHPWINHEWLFQLLAYISFGIGGLTGLLLLKALLLLAALGLMARCGLPHDVPAWIGWAILSSAFWASRFAWDVRADLVSIVFVTALCCHLTIVRKNSHELYRYRFWGWPLLFSVWANMHGGFLLGLAILVAFGAGWMLERRPHLGMFVGWAALCAAATLLNPWGYKLYLSLLNGMLSLRSGFIQEWMKTPWHPLQFFWVCLILYWLHFGIRYRNIGNMPWSLLLVNILLSWSAVKYVRNVPYFMLGAFPTMADSLLIRPFLPVTRWITKNGRQLTIVSAMLTLLFIFRSASRMQTGIDPLSEPVEACSFITQTQLPGHFYNDYPFGGYWIWHFGTTRPVFIDGRLHTVEGYTELYHRVVDAQRAAPELWETFLQTHGIDAALVSYPNHTTLPGALEIYFPKTRWALMYWDDTAMIFLKRLPAYEPWIKTYAFSAVAPDAEPESVLKHMQQSRPWAALLTADLLRNKRLHPESRRVQNWLSLCNSVTARQIQ